MSTGLVVAEAIRIVVSDKHPGNEIGSAADKPGIAEIVGRTGLPSDRLADGAHGSSGATLYNPLHHRDDLKSGTGIGDLLPSIGNDWNSLMLPHHIGTTHARAVIC